MNKLWSVLLVCAMALGSQEVWAKRMGGGTSFGKQSFAVAAISRRIFSTFPVRRAVEKRCGALSSRSQRTSSQRSGSLSKAAS